MSKTVDNFSQQLRALLPPGPLWQVECNSEFDKTLLAFADELLEIDNRVQGLATEANPFTTFELLDDWETALALPGECLADQPQGSVQQRREAIIAKLQRPTGQSRQFYIDLAATLGYDIEIIEHCPFRVGSSTVGQALTNPTDYSFTVGNSAVGQSLANYDVGWVYYWTVRTDEFNETFFKVGENSAGDALATFGNEVLECALNETRPAHTKILYEFV